MGCVPELQRCRVQLYQYPTQRREGGTCAPDDTCVYYMPKISFGRCPNGRWIYTNGEISGRGLNAWAEYVARRVRTSIGDVCGLIRRDRRRRMAIYRKLRITLSMRAQWADDFRVNCATLANIDWNKNEQKQRDAARSRILAKCKREREREFTELSIPRALEWIDQKNPIGFGDVRERRPLSHILLIMYVRDDEHLGLRL